MSEETNGVQNELGVWMGMAEESMLYITASSELVQDFRFRLYGDIRLGENTNSGRGVAGLYTCEKNSIPFHALRTAAFLEVTGKRITSGNLDCQRKDEIASRLHGFAAEILDVLEVGDPKKFAAAALSVIRRAQPFSSIGQYLEALETEHDQFVSAGNKMNAWIRENKGKSAEEKTPPPPRKYLSAPAVIDALTDIEDMVASQTMIIDRAAFRDYVGQFANGFKAQVAEDIRKSLPKDEQFSEIKTALGELAALYEERAKSTETKLPLQDGDAIIAISDKLKQLGEGNLDAIKILNAIQTSKGR